MGSPPDRLDEGACAPTLTATEAPRNGATASKGHGVKHWRRLQPGRDNPWEIAAARLKLAEEIMGKDAIRKL